MTSRSGALAVLALTALLGACADQGKGTDFDFDGVPDRLEDPNDDFLFQSGESNFNGVDTDADGLCDGRPEGEIAGCTGCEDCGNDGSFDPCASETDPLNDDTDNDGARDMADASPGFPVDCATGSPKLAYGASLPPGKPFPVLPTATPVLTATPFPFFTPTPTPTP